MPVPKMTDRPVTLITGASAGIGMALAREFAAHGHELVLIARRGHLLDALADEIATAGGPRPTVIPLDLTRADAVSVISRELAARRLAPQFIVNNAGFGLLGPAAELDHAEQLAIIDLNVRALAALSLAFVDSLQGHKGGILNIGSVAGLLPGPNMAVYYASKAFILSFSEALYQELKKRGVHVTILCPGPVPTEFQARAGIPPDSQPRILMRSAEQVARTGYRALMRRHRRVIDGWPNRIVMQMMRFVPQSLLLKAVAASQSRRQRV
jgi:uncharacterized protein